MRTPAFYLVIACSFWGLSFPVIKALMAEQTGRLPDASSAFIAAWIQVARFVLGALLLLPMVVKLPRPSAIEWRQGLLLALWGGLGMGLQADALHYTEASTSAFLTQAYCVILPLWACVKLRAAPSRRVLLATLLVLIGGAILSGVRPGQLQLGRGETQTVVAAFFFALQILTLEEPRFHATRGRPVTFIMCLAIAALYLPLTYLAAPSPVAMITAGASFSALLLVFSLAMVCTVGAFLLMNTWQRQVSATEAGLIYTSEPVFAAVYALFLPAWLSALTSQSYANETFNLRLLAGGSLILLANAGMQWKRQPHRPAIAPAP